MWRWFGRLVVLCSLLGAVYTHGEEAGAWTLVLIILAVRWMWDIYERYFDGP